MIVVDTNVLAYLLIAGEKTPLAQQTYRQDGNWVVPPLWRHELLNVMVTFVQHGGGDLDDTVGIWHQGVALLASREHEVDMEHALRLACERDISAYDAQFAALAMELGVPLVTEDAQLLGALPKFALSMASFCGHN